MATDKIQKLLRDLKAHQEKIDKDMTGCGWFGLSGYWYHERMNKFHVLTACMSYLEKGMSQAELRKTLIDNPAYNKALFRSTTEKLVQKVLAADLNTEYIKKYTAPKGNSYGHVGKKK